MAAGRLQPVPPRPALSRGEARAIPVRRGDDAAGGGDLGGRAAPDRVPGGDRGDPPPGGHRLPVERDQEAPVVGGRLRAQMSAARRQQDRPAHRLPEHHRARGARGDREGAGESLRDRRRPIWQAPCRPEPALVPDPRAGRATGRPAARSAALLCQRRGGLRAVAADDRQAPRPHPARDHPAVRATRRRSDAQSLGDRRPKAWRLPFHRRLAPVGRTIPQQFATNMEG